MRNPVVTLAIDSHRNTPVMRMNFEKGACLIHKVKNSPGSTRNQSRKFWLITNSDFKMRNALVHISAQIGCVNVSFAESNEEINVILHLHRHHRT